MAVVAIRKNVWDAASNSQRSILRWAMAELALGTPAVYANGGQEFYVFVDSRITYRQVAVLGKLVKGLAGLPRNWSPPMIQDDEGNDVRVDRGAVEAQVYDFVKGNVVLPRDVSYSEGGDLWQETLDAQGAPAAIKAAGAVPASWEAVTDGE